MNPRLALLAAGIVALTASAVSAQTPPDRVFPVFFTEFSTDLDAPALDIVTHAADVAKQFPNEPVKVSGYADQAGSQQADIDLSKARADAVAKLLIADGVDPARITRDAIGTPADSQPGVERRRVEIDIGN